MCGIHAFTWIYDYWHRSSIVMNNEQKYNNLFITYKLDDQFNSIETQW